MRGILDGRVKLVPILVALLGDIERCKQGRDREEEEVCGKVPARARTKNSPSAYHIRLGVKNNNEPSRKTKDDIRRGVDPLPLILLFVQEPVGLEFERVWVAFVMECSPYVGHHSGAFGNSVSPVFMCSGDGTD